MQVGTPRWIGTIEGQYVLNWYLGFGCRVLYLQHVDEIESNHCLIAAHFKEQETPVIMGVGQFAYLLLGIAQDGDTGETQRTHVLPPSPPAQTPVRRAAVAVASSALPVAAAGNLRCLLHTSCPLTCPLSTRLSLCQLMRPRFPPYRVFSITSFILPLQVSPVYLYLLPSSVSLHRPVVPGASSDEVQYLIVDPHYVGPEDAKTVTDKGYVSWQKAGPETRLSPCLSLSPASHRYSLSQLRTTCLH